MYHCSHCDTQYLKWAGRCGECGKWGTIEEEQSQPASIGSTSAKKTAPVAEAPLIDLASANVKASDIAPTGVSELDRVLSGGLVRGSVTLLAGEPGVGKSTLVAQIAAQAKKAYYVSGEESEGQVALRFDRLKLKKDTLAFSNVVDIESVIQTAKKREPSLLIIDSIQTMMTSAADAHAGTPTAVRASTAQLIGYAKQNNVPVIIIGQVTKDGTVAGPKLLEHLVDTVLTLEGDRQGMYRLLRASKHRFGSTDEVGIFEMTEAGLVAVDNPSAKFLEERQSTPGSAITCVMEGTRPLLIEVQALAEKSVFANPIRRTSGFDSGRLQMLLAIINKRTSSKVYNLDIYVNLVGGLNIKEPALDLAVCAAIMSSAADKPLPKEAIFMGELGLGGEIRSIPFLERRIKEAKRLGYAQIYSPKTLKNLQDLKNVF